MIYELVFDDAGFIGGRKVNAKLALRHAFQRGFLSNHESYYRELMGILLIFEIKLHGGISKLIRVGKENEV